MLRISWRDHRTNLSILEEVNTHAQLLKEAEISQTCGEINWWYQCLLAPWTYSWHKETRQTKKAVDR